MVWEDDIWDDLTDLHFPDEDGLLAVLRTYIDASSRDDSGLFSVSGYLIESGRVRRFRKAWRETFGCEKFSWADLIARSQQFKHMRGRENDTEHRRLVSAGVALVREYFIAGAIVSCWQQDIKNHSPVWIRGFAHAYSIASHMLMAGMGDWVKRNNYRGGIAYVLEAGDEYSNEAHELLSNAAKVPEIADLYQSSGSHSFAPKDAGSPFHAPDLLAWEWGKWMTESVIERKRLMRLSMVALLNGRLDHYSFQHLSGEPLLKFFSGIHELGVQQLQEDRAALSSVPLVDVRDVVGSSAQTEPVGDHE